MSAVSPQGRSVELTADRWRYIQRHVEMGELERDGELRLTIPSRVPAADLALALAG